MQDVKQQLFNILESNYGHIEVNAKKELENLISLAVEQEKEELVVSITATLFKAISQAQTPEEIDRIAELGNNIIKIFKTNKE